MRVTLHLLTFVSLWCSTTAAFAADNNIWDKLRAGGQVILMRHAGTSGGIGDPPDFRVDDCGTQRNLSNEGRDEARRIGDALRTRGIRVSEVLASRWCRTVDTAKLAFGKVETWSQLDTAFLDRADKTKQTEAVHQRIALFLGPDNLVLVTHGDNIQALTGIVPGMGGMVVVTPGGPKGFTLLGRIEPEALLASSNSKQ